MTLDEYRQQEFAEVTRHGIYLNHAGVAPSPARVVRAVTDAISWSARDPQGFFEEGVLPLIEAARGRLARLMGVPPEHLALTKNTAHGLSIIADGLILDPGDNVVMADCEYPAVVYPWKAQAWRGIEARLVPIRPDGIFTPDDFAAAMDSRTRVVTLSWVQFGTGFRAELAAFSQMAHAHGALLVADVIQGLGALPLESARIGLDIAATGSHKWLLGPSGTGGLYIAPPVLPRLRLVNMGAASVVDVMKFDPGDFSPKPTAQRYEEGSPNGIGISGLEAALSLLEEVGMETIAGRVLALAARAADALDSKGYRVESSRKASSRSGLVLFRHPRYDNDTLMHALTQAGVTAAVRSGRIRLSPHFYNTSDEIDRAVDALPA